MFRLLPFTFVFLVVLFMWMEKVSARPAAMTKSDVYEVLGELKADQLIAQPPRQSAQSKPDLKPLGAAFAIAPNKFVTSIGVLPLARKGFMSRFYLRSNSGRVYRIQNITRYDSRLEMVEFSLNAPPKNLSLPETAPPIQVGAPLKLPCIGMGQAVRDFAPAKMVKTQSGELGGVWQWIVFSGPAACQIPGSPLLNQENQVVGMILAPRSETTQGGTSQLGRAIASKDLARARQKIALHFDKDAKVSEPGPGGPSASKAFVFKTELPKSPYQLRRALLRAQRTHYLGLRKNLHTRQAADLFPVSGAARQLLRMQDPYFQMAMVSPDGLARIAKPRLRTKSLAGGVEMTAAASPLGGFWAFHLDRPQGFLPQSFLTDPKSIMDTILVSNQWRLHLDGQSHILQSLGIGQRRKPFRDAMGRYWYHHSWPVFADESKWDMYYTPSPQGAYVMLKITPMVEAAPLTFLEHKDQLSRLLLSYKGSSKEIMAFFKLPSRPRLFRKAFLRRSESSWTLGVGDLSFEIPKLRRRVRDAWELKTGLSALGKAEPSLLGLYYKPDPGNFEAVQIRHVYAPNPRGPLAVRRDYHRMVREEAPFDGEVRQTTNGYEIFHVLGPTPKHHVWVTKCNALAESYAEGYCSMNASVEGADQ